MNYIAQHTMPKVGYVAQHHRLVTLAPQKSQGFMQIFSDKLVEVISMDDDFVWIHDYHLLVLPSLLRKRFHRLRCGLFLHSPFPSSEVWRTFPKREELLRSLLNVDLIGD